MFHDSFNPVGGEEADNLCSKHYLFDYQLVHEMTNVLTSTNTLRPLEVPLTLFLISVLCFVLSLGHMVHPTQPTGENLIIILFSPIFQHLMLLL